jgi:hypothetical protein
MEERWWRLDIETTQTQCLCQSTDAEGAQRGERSFAEEVERNRERSGGKGICLPFRTR